MYYMVQLFVSYLKVMSVLRIQLNCLICLENERLIFYAQSLAFNQID